MNVRTGSRAALVVTLLMAACSGGGVDPVPTSSITTRSAAAVVVKVAYFEDSTIDEPLQHELPALQGLRLSIEQAMDDGSIPVEVDIVDLDTNGDPTSALDLAGEVAADPAYVAVVVAPYWSEPDAVARVLDAAGLLTLSLSSLGAPSSGWGGRLRMVPRQAQQVHSLVAYLRTRATPPVCLVGDGSSLGSSLQRRLSVALGAGVAYQGTVSEANADQTDVVANLDGAACGTVAWAGASTGAAELRLAMTQAGLTRITLVSSDVVKTDTYLTTTGLAGEGTVVSCPCADLSTSTELRAQVFEHDYQSEFGTPPAPFAAEGWDAGGLLREALRSGATSRSGVRTALEGIERYAGLAHHYRFGPGGELEGGAGVAFFVDRGQRWARPRWQEREAGLPRPCAVRGGRPGLSPGPF